MILSLYPGANVVFQDILMMFKLTGNLDILHWSSVKTSTQTASRNTTVNYHSHHYYRDFHESQNTVTGSDILLLMINISRKSSVNSSLPH